MTATILWEAESSSLQTAFGTSIQPWRSDNDSLEYHTSPTIVANLLIGDLKAALMTGATALGIPLEETRLLVWSHNELPHYVHVRKRNEKRGVTDENLDIFEFRDDTFVTTVCVDDGVVNTFAGISGILGPLLKAHGAYVSDVYHINTGGRDALEVRLTVDPTMRIGQLLDVANMVRLAVGSPLDPRTADGAYLLLATGSPQALLGQPESATLEVKQKGYNFESEAQKQEFSLDLAALANTEQGGLLIIGMRTVRNEAKQDIIAGIPACIRGSLIPDQYAQIAKQRIVPSIEGIVFHLADYHAKHLLAIHVPPQPDYLRPFIVRGGVTAGGNTSGASFTIPHRIGDTRWNMTPEAIHSLLVAARIALRQPQA